MSAAESVETVLAAIAEHNGEVNAFCRVFPQEARARAAELDALPRALPLAGRTFSVKDAMAQQGVPCTVGSRALAESVPAYTVSPVERLEAAGAIAIGRTNVPEFCYRGTSKNDLYGATGNPWDPTRSAGGSSGGAACAVALGLGEIALGSDGGGSIRIPASFCGVVGFKATYGIVPHVSDSAGWLTLTHVGPITRTVGECALALSVIAGPDARDPLSAPALPRDYLAAARPGDLRGLRVAITPDLGYIRTDDGVREAFERAVERFATLGCTIERADPGLASPLDTWNTIACGDNLVSEGDLLESGLVGDDTRALIEAGAEVTAREYVAARNEMWLYAKRWAQFMSRYDLVLMPAMECVAFPLDQWSPREIGGVAVGEFYDDYCHFSYPFNLTGMPAISVPMGTAEHDLPIGLQIVGRRYEDEVVLRAAAAWEAIAPWGFPTRTPQPGSRPRAGTIVEGRRVLCASSPRGDEWVVETTTA